MRSPSLDSWFALTANLGTHTFYMVMLPILIWCGYVRFGRGLVESLLETARGRLYDYGEV
jgi:hypothetical protein